MSSDAFEAKLAAMQADWAAALPGRVDAIADKLAELSEAAAWDAAAALELRRSVHSLAGAGATFGLREVSTRARALELALQAIDEAGRAPEPGELAECDTLLAALRETAESDVSR